MITLPLKRVYTLAGYEYVNHKLALMDAVVECPEVSTLLGLCKGFTFDDVIPTSGIDINGDPMPVTILILEFQLLPEDHMLYKLGK